ncbi:uncharacterized protein P174DRAFT_452813 [Aspergillus novofumigatus IBT 16806]|uniref:Uncharacterized protein n=1 Tax=Aspergillus novofumigatus (strain IBT 16806) TaxID=1392255 RepID=A0A2I1C1K3_ASPN1|nr:uncharacterized protein P174DRAFT_452813 [Aspergillus novofumigatus IBT 16806]PKX91517.1 hypothetical protein P174DRAFT_452813 [Aspergillus novofumigatus IBT 16806]
MSSPVSPKSSSSSSSSPGTEASPMLRGNSKPIFLFIDSQADNPQNPSLNKQKQAFVLRNYHRKKKQASIERLKPSKPSKPSLCLVHGRTSNFSPAYPWDALAEENEEFQSDRPQGTLNRVAKMSEMWSLKAYLSQGFVDPFSASAVQMSDSMNLPDPHHRLLLSLDSTRMSIWWWQRAISQPALLQALLFLTAGHHATLESNNGVSSTAIEKSIKDSLRLRGNTLKTLNDILHDPIKAVAESTTLIVASLVAIEAVDANFEAVHAHMKGLKRLINLLGGLDALDHMTLSKIYQSDVKSAALQNSRPTFPMSARWRSEILQESTLFRSTEHLRVSESLEALGSRFFAAPWYPPLDNTLKTFVQILRRLIIYFETAQQQPSIVLPTDNDLFLVLEHQLLSAAYETGTTLLQEPLRLSLLIYLNLRIWHFQAFPFMQFMVEGLRRSLVPAYGHAQSTAPDLVFWILFIGGMASQGYKCHPWFVSRLAEMARRLDLVEWEKARETLGGFFYTDQPGERGAENLWNEVLLMESYPYIAPKPTFQVLML